jgi:hypothetical protein
MNVTSSAIVIVVGLLILVVVLYNKQQIFTTAWGQLWQSTNGSQPSGASTTASGALPVLPSLAGVNVLSGSPSAPSTTNVVTG